MQKIIRQYILIICGVFLTSYYVTAQNDEIVVPDMPEYQDVAFGKQFKKQVTASVFSISGEELLTSRTNNLLIALQGRLPGLRIIQTDGEPGRESFDNHLRGYDSPNHNGIMYIIDGVERYPFGIDIHEVDRVTILRDAAAVSMYGMRASGGVLIITTKRGSEGKSKISVSIDHSMQAPTRLPDFVNAFDYANMYNQRQANDTLYSDRQSIASGGTGIDHSSTKFYTPFELDRYRLSDNTQFYPVRNMVDDFLKDYSQLSRVNVNFRGGSPAMRFFTSIGYSNQGGLFDSEPFEKYSYDNSSKTQKFNFRTNMDIDVNSTLNVWLNIGGYMEKVNLPFVGGGLGWNDLIAKLYQTPNNAYNDLTPEGEVIVKRDKLTFATNRSIYGDLNRTGSQLQTNTRLNNTFGARQNLDKITEGLSASAQVAFDIYSMGNQTRSRTYEAYEVVQLPGVLVPDSLGFAKVTGTNNSTLADGFNTSFYYMYNMRLAMDYNRTFGEKHNIGGMLIAERHMQQQQILVATNYMGINGRVTYGFNNRYFAEANFSYQGSEQFKKGNRYGFFPSISAAWLVSNEEFLKNSNSVNYLKLRASVGQVGNNVYGYGAGNQYLFLDTWNSDAQQTQLGNPKIKWETSTKYNVGIESKLFNALTVEADVFYNMNTDIIVRDIATIPDGMMGLGSTALPPLNVGEVTNKGFELFVAYNKQITADLSVNLSGNVSYNQNVRGYMAELPYDETYAYPLRNEGYAINYNWGYKTAGLFSSQAEIDGWADQSALGGVPIPGDIKYLDLTGDGKVDVKDQAPLGIGQAPELTGGFMAQLGYKWFDISAFFTGAARRNVYLGGFGWSSAIDNFTENMKSSWSPEKAASGEEILFPRLGRESANYVKSDYWLKDGAFLRLRNVELGFTLPERISKKIGSSSIRFYANGLNLLVWDKLAMDDFDPESANSSTTNYPLLKACNFGVNVKF
jgi:TonB-linked SusC/RagA family outer membrane protein